MGLDGGTIATRSDILRRSSMRLADGDRTRSTRGGCIAHAHISEVAQDHPQTKFVTCALSHEPLDQLGGIVACRLGYLYNLSSFNDYMFKEGIFSSERCSILNDIFPHLKSNDDVISVNISIISNPNQDSEGGNLILRCPVTELHANGNHNFVVLWNCGCVMSRKVIDVVSSVKSSGSDCPSCACNFQKSDVVPLHPPRLKVQRNDTVGAMIAQEKRRKELSNSLSVELLNSSSSSTKRDRLQIESIEKFPSSSSSSSSLATTDIILHSSSNGNTKQAKKMRIKANSRVPTLCMIGSQAIQNSISISTMTKQNKQQKKEAIRLKRLLQQAELAEGWECLESKSKPGRYYYRNQKLKITQWERP